MNFFVAVGMMLSPRVFMSLGNATGVLDAWTFAWIALLCLWGIVCWRSNLPAAVLPGRFFFPHKALEWKALIFAAAMIRLTLFCLLATSVMALAGFSFNEVFYYQFPNMGFTFLLLLVVCGSHLFDDKVPRVLQYIFSLGAILGFGFIAVAGVLSSPEMIISTPQIHQLPLNEVGVSLAPALLLFVGFELAGIGVVEGTRSKILWELIALLFMALLFSVFVQAARLHVPLEKLAYSSVPHMIIGRRILGETGRYLAGGAVILGSAAAVNALLMAWGNTVRKHLVKRAHSDGISKVANRTLVGVVPFVFVTILLWAGYAGEPILEIWLGIAFAFYLLIYVGRGIACITSRPWTGMSVIITSSLLALMTFYGTIERTFLLLE